MKNNIKNKINYLFRITAVIAYSITIGCQKNSENTTTGNPLVSLAATSSAANATIAMAKPSFFNLFFPKAIAYPPPATLLDAAGNTVVIQAVWVNFGAVEFKFEETATGAEVDGDSVEFTGPYSVDLLSPAPTTFVTGAINLAQMRRMKIKLVRVTGLPSGAPADFLNKSMYIQGTVNGHAFSYSTEDESVVEIAGPQIVSAVESRTLLLELQVANLIKKMNLSTIVGVTNITDGNRVAVVTPCASIDASATDLFTCFYKGFETESNLGRDDDGDFHLDVDEGYC